MRECMYASLGESGRTPRPGPSHCCSCCKCGVIQAQDHHGAEHKQVVKVKIKEICGFVLIGVQHR